MSVSEIRNQQDFNTLQAQFPIIVVDNYADWCQPCKYLSPLYHELAKEFQQYPQIHFAQCDHNTNLFQVDALPTILIFSGGNIVNKIMGADVEKIRLGVQQVLGLAASPAPSGFKENPFSTGRFKTGNGGRDKGYRTAGSL
jgi:thioredoxin 1